MANGDDQSDAGTSAGAGAQIDTGEHIINSSDGVVINYYFPVTVEIRTETAAIDTDALVELALARLAESFESA